MYVGHSQKCMVRGATVVSEGYYSSYPSNGGAYRGGFLPRVAYVASIVVLVVLFLLTPSRMCVYWVAASGRFVSRVIKSFIWLILCSFSGQHARLRLVPKSERLSVQRSVITLVGVCAGSRKQPDTAHGLALRQQLARSLSLLPTVSVYNCACSRKECRTVQNAVVLLLLPLALSKHYTK